MQIKFLSDSSALLIENNITDLRSKSAKDNKYLVIADLHIGIELELARKGIMVPNQLPKFQEKLDKLIEETGAKELIILGDVKHEYRGISWIELRDLPEFFKHMLKKIKIRIIKGNHDGGIEAIAPAGVKVYEPTGFILSESRSDEKIALTHGQAWPKKEMLDCKTLIMGHIHPAIEFWSSGARMTEHVWIKAKINRTALEKKYKKKCSLEQAIIIPTFNHLAGGIAFNSESFAPHDPLLKNAIDWKNAEVFLLDGTSLGELNKIKSAKKK